MSPEIFFADPKSRSEEQILLFGQATILGANTGGIVFFTTNDDEHCKNKNKNKKRPMTTNDDLRLDGTRFEQPSWLVLVEGLRCLTYLQDRNIGFHGRMGRHGCVSMVSAW
jgi:hypothetical protein